MKKTLCVVIMVAWAFAVWAQTPSNGDQPVMVHAIIVSGLVPQNKSGLDTVLKSYRNKRLSSQDIDGLIRAVKKFYLEAGYDGLVNMDYTLRKNRLAIRVFLDRH